METQEDKNKQKQSKEQIKALEKEMKLVFKAGNHEGLKATAEKLKALDPENRLVEKLLKKDDKRMKAVKVNEYEGMLKKLLKDKNSEKLSALAKEFKDFDPENRRADKWMKKAQKLDEKLHGKKIEVAKQKAVVPGQGAPVTVAAPTPAPAAPASVTPGPQAAAPAPAETPKPAVPVKKEAVSGKDKGNIFTKMFGKKEEETQKKSIIDTIVAKTDRKDEKQSAKKVEVKKEKISDGSRLLAFSRVFLNFTAIFVVLSAGFLYVEWIDRENTMLSLVGVSENTGSKLHKVSEELRDLKRQEAVLSKDIEVYKGGYDDTALGSIQTVVEDRINWPDIFAKINEVTNSVYELNDFFKYIEYNNYSLDAENGTVRVTGTLSDPLGRNLTKLVELEEAFKHYPKDMNNPDDPTKPYFSGFREFNSFSKTLDTLTGRYTSSFQLSFSLNE